MFVIDNIVYYSQFLRDWADYVMGGHTGKHQGCHEAEKEGGTVGNSFYYCFHGKE